MDYEAGLTEADIEDEIARGGKVVVYLYCVSLLVITFKRSSRAFFIRAGESRFWKGMPYTLLTLLLGWWGIPWGPIYTLEALITNLSGGRDLTAELASRLGLSRKVAAASTGWWETGLPLPIEIRVSRASGGGLNQQVAASRYLSQAEINEALSVAAPLLVSSQLGALRVGEALSLCERACHYLETGSRGPALPAGPLAAARILLARSTSDSGRVTCQFMPEGAPSKVSDADAAQLIGTYFEAAMARADPEVRERLAAFTLTAVCYYLDQLAQHAGDGRHLSLTVHIPSAMGAMVKLTGSMYERWVAGEVPSDPASLLRLARDTMQSLQPAIS